MPATLASLQHPFVLLLIVVALPLVVIALALLFGKAAGWAALNSRARPWLFGGLGLLYVVLAVASQPNTRSVVIYSILAVTWMGMALYHRLRTNT